MSLSCLQTSWPNKCLWASTTYCIKTVLLGTGLAGHRVKLLLTGGALLRYDVWYLSTKFGCWFKSFVTSPQETFCDKENWNILLIQVIQVSDVMSYLFKSVIWCPANSSHLCSFKSMMLLHLKKRFLLIQVIYAHSSQWCDGPAHLFLNFKKRFAIRKTEISY